MLPSARRKPYYALTAVGSRRAGAAVARGRSSTVRPTRSVRPVAELATEPGDVESELGHFTEQFPDPVARQKAQFHVRQCADAVLRSIQHRGLQETCRQLITFV